MLTCCIPCSNTKQTIKELTIHIKDMAFKVFKAYRHLKTRSMTTIIDKTAMTTASESDATVTLQEEEEEEEKPMEWVIEVDCGVFMTFISQPPQRRNLLKKIQFSKDKFNGDGAKMWWIENYDKITELYSVERTFLPRESVVVEAEDNPVAPSCSPEGDPIQSRNSCESMHTSRPNLSSTTTEDMSSTEACAMSSDSDFDEWQEEDAPGVSLTIRSYPDGTRKIMHIYFSPETFNEETKMAWWEENKDRVHDRYVVFYVF